MPTGIYKHKPLSKKHKKNISKGSKGHIVLPKTRRKIGKVNKVNTKRLWQNPDYRKHMSKIHIGQTKGSKNYFWKGGKIRKAGYIYIWKPNHPFASKQGYVFEHRLIVEKQIKRYLLPIEKCHHLGAKDDNCPRMLMAFVNHSAHMRFERGGKVKPSEIIFDGRKINSRQHPNNLRVL